MRKYLAFIFCFSIIIIISCNNNNNNNNINANNQLYLITNLYNNINKRLDYYYKLDSSLFSKRRNRLNEIHSEFTTLRNKLNTNFTDQEIDEIKIKLLQLGASDNDISSYITILKTNNLSNNEKLLKLNFLELLILEIYNDFYSQMFYNAFQIEPIVVPNKNPIKLGEEYKCNVYLTGVNGFEFIGKANNQALKNENGIPYFKIRPTSKGRQEFKGELGLKWNIMSKDTFFLPFTISIDVK